MKPYRPLALAALVTCTASASSLVACGSSSTPSSDDGSTVAGDAGPDGTVVVVAPPGESTDGGDAGGSDSAVDAAPAACNPTEQVDLTQVFVSPNGVAGSNCSPGQPCPTISSGIAAAVANGKTTVYVAEGTYSEQITLHAGLAIRGARSSANQWEPICGDARVNATVVNTPPTYDRSVIAVDLAGAASLEALYIQNQAVAQPGQSLYGVFATGATTTLTLTDVSLFVPQGGDGANGADGAAGNTAGGPSAAPDCSQTVATPAPATPATPAPTPGANVSYSAVGATVSTGSTGTIGGPGQSNSSFGQGTCEESDVCEKDTVDGPNITCDADHTDLACARGGSGCGGGPGGMGAGGEGGGSSIALFAFDAHVIVNDGQLMAGPGGNGGNGGAGGIAGAAGDGLAGTASVCVACPANGTCTCSAHMTIHGTNGLPGTPGAAGLAGAGGAGGDSFAYFANAGNVEVSLATGKSLYENPAPGGSGSPPGPPGIAGGASN